MTSTPSFLASKALRMLERAVHTGHLKVVTPEGQTHDFAGATEGPSGTIIINDWRAVSAAMARGDIGFGEAHMAGWWDSPDLEALFAVLLRNSEDLGQLAWGTPINRAFAVIRDRVVRRNSVTGARRNIMAHYDLGNAFYSLWLDPSMSYSSALYRDETADLGEAQQAKYGRILDKLGDARSRVLEIGCGWGGFIEAALERNKSVTGLTISDEQFRFARERISGQADVRLQDYRACQGRFDAIVSIEMFEAVGERYWPAYFRTLSSRLLPGGTAVIQTISITEKLFPGYRTSSDFIRHHVFPGGMLPTISRFKSEAQRAGLACRDVFSFGASYAQTLRDWLARFDASLPDVRALGFDEAFIRGWRLYLAICAAGFANGRIDVHQIELEPQA
jgi:cyclopropane-fatty-acyl-phospholipid synthase